MANQAFGLLHAVGDNPIALQNFLPGTTFDPNDFQVNTIVRVAREGHIVNRTLFAASLYTFENGKVVRAPQSIGLEPQATGRESWVMGGVVVRKNSAEGNNLIAFANSKEGEVLCLLFFDPIKVGQWEHRSIVLPIPQPCLGLKYDTFRQVTKIEILRHGVPVVEQSLHESPKLVFNPSS